MWAKKCNLIDTYWNVSSMILIAPHVTIVLSISIVMLWVPIIWSSTSLFSLYGLLHMGHLKYLSLRTSGSSWASLFDFFREIVGGRGGNAESLAWSILGSWGCGFIDLLATPFENSRHFGQVHSCPLSSISFPFFGLMPTQLPWNHSKQVSG